MSWQHPAFSGLEAFDNVAACAAAYQVGRTEAGAATNLFSAVSKETKEKLKELVRTVMEPIDLRNLV